MDRGGLERIKGLWSSSKLTTLRNCPKRFFFTYVLDTSERRKLQEEYGYFPMPAELEFGKAVHYMLKHFFNVKFRSADSFAKQLFMLWEGVRKREHGSDSFRRPRDPWELRRPLHYRRPEEEDLYKGLTFTIAREFFAQNLMFRDGTAPRPTVEKLFRHTLMIPLSTGALQGEESGVSISLTVRGIVDRLQPLAVDDPHAPYRIQDYKTGFIPGPEEARRKEQQLFYRLLTSLHAEREAEGFDFIRLPGYKLESVHFDHAPEERLKVLLQTEMWLREAWAYVSAVLDRRIRYFDVMKWKVFDPATITPGEFRIHPGTHCERCEFRSVCVVGLPASKKHIAREIERFERMHLERISETQGGLFEEKVILSQRGWSRKRKLTEAYKRSLRLQGGMRHAEEKEKTER